MKETIVELEHQLELERRQKQVDITDAVIYAKENERRQLGIELHDNVIQLLATARMYISMAMPVGKQTNGTLIEDANQYIAKAIDEIRNLSHNLVSPSFEKSGLRKSLKQLAQTVSKTSGLKVSCEIKLHGVSIEKRLSLAIYRIAQEQFNNIIKHARARTISVKLLSVNHKITLLIADDGVGFNTASKQTGIGLLNIQIRASLFNGKVAVKSKPGAGCELTAIFSIQDIPVMK